MRYGRWEVEGGRLEVGPINRWEVILMRDGR